DEKQRAQEKHHQHRQPQARIRITTHEDCPLPFSRVACDALSLSKRDARSTPQPRIEQKPNHKSSL
ncbi:MAG: hypothetical protein ABSB33_07760, partial [Tepidisphaeraceae bacterium]